MTNLSSSDRIIHHNHVIDLKNKIIDDIEIETEGELLSFIDIIGVLEWVKMEMYDKADYAGDEDDITED